MKRFGINTVVVLLAFFLGAVSASAFNNINSNDKGLNIFSFKVDVMGNAEKTQD